MLKSYQMSLKKVMVANAKIEKKIKGTYLWDGESAASIILNNMMHEAGKPLYRYLGYANFIAYRLKFADDKTIQFMQDALFDKKKHFTDKIYGKYTLYETMQIWNCDYFEALMCQYMDSPHAKNSKYSCHYRLPDIEVGPVSYRVKCSELSEDGTKIIFMSREDWEKKYGPVEMTIVEGEELSPFLREWSKKQFQPIGPVEVSYEFKPKTEEERALFLENLKKRHNAIGREIKVYEKKFGKKEKKWSDIEENEFREHLEDLRAQGILI